MSLPWSTKNLPKQIFINNEYVESKSSKKLTLHNPKDGSLIANDVSLAGEQDVDAAVAAAEKAFPAWKKTAPSERRNIMNKFAELIEKNSLAIAELSRISLGAPYKAFGAFEIGLCAEVCVPIIPSNVMREVGANVVSIGLPLQRRLDRQIRRRVLAPGRWLPQNRAQRATWCHGRRRPLERPRGNNWSQGRACPSHRKLLYSQAFREDTLLFPRSRYFDKGSWFPARCLPDSIW